MLSLIKLMILPKTILDNGEYIQLLKSTQILNLLKIQHSQDCNQGIRYIILKRLCFLVCREIRFMFKSSCSEHSCPRSQSHKETLILKALLVSNLCINFRLMPSSQTRILKFIRVRYRYYFLVNKCLKKFISRIRSFRFLYSFIYF